MSDMQLNAFIHKLESMTRRNMGGFTKENFDELYSSIAICCGAFVMSFWLKIHPIIIVILSAIVGYLIYGL